MQSPERSSSNREKSVSSRRARRAPLTPGRRTLLSLLIFFCLLLCSLSFCGYFYLESSTQGFFHPVSRGQGEPPDDGAITGHAWNILLLGSDNDNKYSFPALLTQVMMVVHVDPGNNSVALVSIPRDSWVPVPEVGGMHKIDQAFLLGASPHSRFDDGVRLARMTIEQDYGITIDRYAWVGLNGFASIIDTLGGVDIDLTHPVVDDAYPDDTHTNTKDPYALQRLYLAPGPQHLNGLQALEYVRTRHSDLVGDIGRTERQQQVLLALEKKLTATNVLTHLQSLIADMQGKMYTDLSQQEMLAFAGFAHGLSSSSIQHVTLGPGNGAQNYGTFSQVYDPLLKSDQDVLLPQCQNIQPLLDNIFGFGTSCNINNS